eukprot:2718413-Rhodomonas_salina.1
MGGREERESVVGGLGGRLGLGVADQRQRGCLCAATPATPRPRHPSVFSSTQDGTMGGEK